MLWMLWSIEKSADPFGIEHYRQKYGAAPNRAEVSPDCPEEKVNALAAALQVTSEQIRRTRHCAPGLIFLTCAETQPTEEKSP
jgi:hypothetical protein